MDKHSLLIIFGVFILGVSMMGLSLYFYYNFEKETIYSDCHDRYGYKIEGAVCNHQVYSNDFVNILNGIFVVISPFVITMAFFVFCITFLIRRHHENI